MERFESLIVGRVPSNSVTAMEMENQIKIPASISTIRRTIKLSAFIKNVKLRSYQYLTYDNKKARIQRNI